MNPCNSTSLFKLSLTQRTDSFLRIAQLFLTMVSLVSVNVDALESDRDQSIQIESDRAEFRELEGLTIYSGNVRMSQGSILLIADEVSIHAENGNVSRLIATGDRAYYEQLPAPGEDKIVAQGETIEYVLADDLINLISNASLTQQGATLNGSQITYDVRNHLLRASSNMQNSTDTQNTRVRVTIPSLDTSPSAETGNETD